MKKFLIAILISAMTGTAVLAEPQTNTKNPEKYELGKYNFNFNTINSEPVSTQEPSLNTDKTDIKTQIKLEPTIKPISKKIVPQKDLIEQIKSEENKTTDLLKEKSSEIDKTIKQDAEKTTEKINITKDKTEEIIKENSEKTQQLYDNARLKTDDTVKKEIKKIEQNYGKTYDKIDKSNGLNQKSGISTKEKQVKFDKDKPPFRFQIQQMQYQGESSTSIEKL